MTPDHVPPHEPAPGVPPAGPEHAHTHQGEGVGPGQQVVLVPPAGVVMTRILLLFYYIILTPPSRHHQRHVEAQHEHQRNGLGVLVAVTPQTLECLPDQRLFHSAIY